MLLIWLLSTGRFFFSTLQHKNIFAVYSKLHIILSTRNEDHYIKYLRKDCPEKPAICHFCSFNSSFSYESMIRHCSCVIKYLLVSVTTTCLTQSLYPGFLIGFYLPFIYIRMQVFLAAILTITLSKWWEHVHHSSPMIT